jgi:hypothetical protein
LSGYKPKNTTAHRWAVIVFEWINHEMIRCLFIPSRLRLTWHRQAEGIVLELQKPLRFGVSSAAPAFFVSMRWISPNQSAAAIQVPFVPG